MSNHADPNIGTEMLEKRNILFCNVKVFPCKITTKIYKMDLDIFKLFKISNLAHKEIFDD